MNRLTVWLWNSEFISGVGPKVTSQSLPIVRWVCLLCSHCVKFAILPCPYDFPSIWSDQLPKWMLSCCRCISVVNDLPSMYKLGFNLQKPLQILMGAWAPEMIFLEKESKLLWSPKGPHLDTWCLDLLPYCTGSVAIDDWNGLLTSFFDPNNLQFKSLNNFPCLVIWNDFTYARFLSTSLNLSYYSPLFSPSPLSQYFCKYCIFWTLIVLSLIFYWP